VSVGDDESFDISPSLASEIEDAVMFGKAQDLELILESASDDVLPADVRQTLESLHYFRAHYGNSALDEIDRKKANLMDSAWTMELLNKIRSRIDAAMKKTA